MTIILFFTGFTLWQTWISATPAVIVTTQHEVKICNRSHQNILTRLHKQKAERWAVPHSGAKDPLEEEGRRKDLGNKSSIQTA